MKEHSYATFTPNKYSDFALGIIRLSQDIIMLLLLLYTPYNIATQF